MPGAREAADPWLPAGQAAATASAMAATAAPVKVGAKRSSNASAAPAHPLSTLRRCSPQWQLRRGATRPSSLCLHRRLLCKKLLQAGSACKRAGSRWRELNRCSVLTPSLHSSDASAIQQALGPASLGSGDRGPHLAGNARRVGHWLLRLVQTQQPCIDWLQAKAKAKPQSLLRCTCSACLCTHGI